MAEGSRVYQGNILSGLTSTRLLKLRIINLVREILTQTYKKSYYPLILGTYFSNLVPIVS